jgi:hypothetical protein
VAKRDEMRTHVNEVNVVDVAVLGDELIVDSGEGRCMLILGGESERGDDGEQIDGLMVDGESLEKDGGHPDSRRGEMEQRRDLRTREVPDDGCEEGAMLLPGGV